MEYPKKAVIGIIPAPSTSRLLKKIVFCLAKRMKNRNSWRAHKYINPIMNLTTGIEAIRKLIGAKTRTPPIAIVAYALANDNAVVAAYADKTTGLLSQPAAIPGGTPLLFSTPQSLTNQVVTSANGAVTIQNSTVVITKTGSLAALTLAVPTAAQNGTRITFTSMTAFAHTITCPSAIVNNGVTGDPFTVITLAAFAGGGVTLEAYGGFWNVVANVISTFA
jgi:hypothetical protein